MVRRCKSTAQRLEKAVHGLTAGGLAPIKMKEDTEWSMMVGGDEETKGLGDKWIWGAKDGEWTSSG